MKPALLSPPAFFSRPFSRSRPHLRAGAGQDHEGVRRPVAGDENVRPDRPHEISRLQQTMHVGRSACSRSSAAAEKPEAASPPPAAEPAAKPSGGRAAMVARMRACGAEWKSAEAEGKVPAAQKWPEFRERVQQAQEGGGDVRLRQPPTGRGDLLTGSTWLTWPQTRAANQSGRPAGSNPRPLAVHDDAHRRRL